VVIVASPSRWWGGWFHHDGRRPVAGSSAYGLDLPRPKGRSRRPPLGSKGVSADGAVGEGHLVSAAGDLEVDGACDPGELAGARPGDGDSAERVDDRDPMISSPWSTRPRRTCRSRSSQLAGTVADQGRVRWTGEDRPVRDV